MLKQNAKKHKKKKKDREEMITYKKKLVKIF